MGPLETKFDLSTATTLAGWIEDTYKAYLDYLDEGEIPVSFEGKRSGDWDAGSSIRVSKIAKECPKFSAASTKGLVDKKVFSYRKKALFEDARRVAEQVYEAITWGTQSQIGTWHFLAEVRTTTQDRHWTKLVGTIDGVLYRNGRRFPIEIKSTSIDKYNFMTPKGVSYDMFKQCIGEMVLIGDKDYGDCPFGYIFTRYNPAGDKEEDDKKDFPVCKAWTVAWSSHWDGWFLYYKNEEMTAKADDKEWPTLPDGRIFLSATEYDRLAKEHVHYMNSDSPIEEDSPYKFLENWRCAKVKAQENYALTGTYKGSKKPGTGIVIPRCPLFDLCFHKELEAGGYKNAGGPLDEYELDRLV